MQKPVKRLGRGLSSLISVTEEPVPAVPAATDAGQPAEPTAVVAEQGPLQLAVQQIRPNPFQPRRALPPEQLKALADSIRTSGLLQPIVVRDAGGSVYELIAGERRWRAAQLAGLTRIPVVVREATNEQMLELALVENIFREDLNAIDRALAYRRYRDEFGLTAEEVASRLGEDRTTVTNYLRLLELPSEVKDLVAEGKLSMGNARCLLALKSSDQIVQLARKAVQEGLSVRALEALVRQRVDARAAASQPVKSEDQKRPQIRALELAFVRAIGTKVEIRESRRKGSGKIIIHYANLDDFDRLSARLGVEPD